MSAFHAVSPSPHPLPSATRLGMLELSVADLGIADFYTRVIGLELLKKSGTQVSLGAGGRELLRLSLKPGAKHYEHRTGLYHFCLAMPQRRDFGLLLKRILDSQVPLQGLVDHHVAEAIYLPDPEGNGIELNWDTPRETWPESMTAMMRMGNGPLDTEGLLKLAAEKGPDTGRLPADAVLGHIHLHVAKLAESRDFYHGLLGFDVMGEFPRQAVFVSAGGYHHHVAFNIWNGVGAPEPPADAGGLLWFSVTVPEEAALQALLKRAKEAGQEAEPAEGGWLLRDPSGNGLVLRKSP
jgi:catechol 2,3-dioxygenase